MQAHALFATPIFTTEIDDAERVCRAVNGRLLAEEKQSKGEIASNRGGAWQSDRDLATRNDPMWDAVAGLLLRHVREAFDLLVDATGRSSRAREYRYGMQMWGMVCRNGGYVSPHCHSGVDWATVLYTEPGAPHSIEGDDLAGTLSFMDPRRIPAEVSGEVLFPSSFTIRPRAGLLLVFPGWMLHHVHPYRAERPRISVAANVRLLAG